MDEQTVRQLVVPTSSKCIQLAPDIHYLPHCCSTEIMLSLGGKVDDFHKKGLKLPP